MALLHTVSQYAIPVNQRVQYQGRGTGTYKWKAVTFNAVTCAVPAAIYQNACGGKESKFVHACTGLRTALIMKRNRKPGYRGVLRGNISVGEMQLSETDKGPDDRQENICVIVAGQRRIIKI